MRLTLITQAARNYSRPWCWPHPHSQFRCHLWKESKIPAPPGL